LTLWHLDTLTLGFLGKPGVIFYGYKNAKISNMNVLMISTDRNIFKKDSAVRVRMIEYGKLFDDLDIIIFAKNKVKHATEKISDNTTIYSTNSFSKLTYIRNAIKIGKKMSGNKIDIVTTQDPFETGLAGQKLSKIFNAKLHVQIHTDFLNENFVKHSFLNKIRVDIAKSILPKADGIRVVSERIKRSLEVFDLKKGLEIKVLPIFVEADKFLNTTKANKFTEFDKTILTVSRLESEKKVDLLIDAFSEVLKKFPNTGLIIVGDGNLKESLISKAEKLGISKNVIFVGSVSNIEEYYAGAEIYIQTSEYEGFGLALFEAALSGLPIISSDVGLVGDILKDNESLLVTELSKEGISRNIEKLFEDEVLSRELSSIAKSKAFQNSISKEEYLRKYKESLNL
jgi:1,2-diacylglycerol 3-alpha-glucosyltransferase